MYETLTGGNTMVRVRDILKYVADNMEVSVFDTHGKYTMIAMSGRSKEEVMEKYGDEFIIECDKHENGMDIFI